MRTGADALDRRLKTAGICGLAAPAVSLVCIFAAISLSPWFSWAGNALSDLGVGEAAWLFNSGLVAGGVLTTVFALGLFIPYQDQARRFGALLFFFSALSLVGIGIFSEAAGRTHFYFSVAFFALLALSLMIIGIGSIVARSRKFGVLTLAIGAVAALPWAFPWGAVAVPELISALAGSVWAAIHGAQFLRGRRDPGQNVDGQAAAPAPGNG